jgi:hypothetical protein
MRFRLRTLLIVLALGPAVLAGMWWWLDASPTFGSVSSEQGLVLAVLGTIVFAIAVRR